MSQIEIKETGVVGLICHLIPHMHAQLTLFYKGEGD